jgi:uncharacterized protein (TIGR03437 family)
MYTRHFYPAEVSVRRIPLTYLANLALLVTVAAPGSNAQVANSGVNQWTLAAAMSASRSQACSAILQDGSLLVAGGTSGSGPVNSVEIYGTSGAFTLTSSMNQARAGAACATLPDGRVLVVGGDDGNGALKTVEIYNPVQQTWTPTGSLATAREGHQVMVNAWGGVWVAGGTNASGIVGTLEQYDPYPGQFVTLGTLITPRTEFAMAPLPHGRVMIAGGTNGTSAISSVEIGNQFGVVSAGGSLAVARQDFAITGLPDGTFLVTGGKDVNGNLLNSTEIFDPVAGVSTAGPNLLTARAYHSAYGLTNNGAVVIAGGTGSSGVLSSTETYSPWTGAIQQSAPMHSSRRNNVSAILRPGSLLVAGGLNDTGPLNSSELFQYVTIGTDKPDYHPGTAVNISGSGWQPGEQVSVQIVAVPEDLHHIEFTGSGIADGSGNVTVSGFAVDQSDLNMKFVLTATGSQFQAQTSFTDGPINPTIAYTFSPTSGSLAAAGSAVQVTATFSGANGPPLGLFEACLNGTCGANNISNTGTCSASAGVFTLPGGSSDSCVFTIISIPAGTTQVGVFYFDNVDSNYNQVQPPGTNVPYAVLSPTTTSMTGGPSGANVPYGDATPYTASVTTQNGNAATGQVQFLVGGLTTYNGGAQTIPLVSLSGAEPNYTASWVPNPPFAVGSTDVVTAQFVGDPVNITSTSGNNVSSTIVAAGTTTTLTASVGASETAGQLVTLTATVSAAAVSRPSGTFSFALGGNIVAGTSTCGSPVAIVQATGVATCQFQFAGPGTTTENYTATYSGNSNFLTSNNLLTLNTVKATATTTVTEVNNITVIQVTPVAPATGAPTGTVTISNGSSMVAVGTLASSTACTAPAAATCAIFSVTLGSGAYSASYSGDQNFQAGSSASTSVNRTTPATTLSLTSSLYTVSAGTAVTLTAFVSGTGATTSPTGAVTFTDNGNVLPGGTVQVTGSAATLNNIVLPSGPNTILATYSGDSTYPGSTAIIGVYVGASPSIVTFSASSGTAVYGQTLTLSVRVANGLQGGSTPTGTVQFYDNTGSSAIAIGSPVALSATGTATLTVSNLPPGTNSVYAVFTPVGSYGAGQSPLTAGAIVIGKATTILPTPAITDNNGQETVTATVKVAPPGGGTPTGTVTFIDTVTGKVLGTPQTLAGGTASITIPVTLDPISATYSGDSNFFTGSTTTNVSAIAAVNAASFNASYPITFAADEIVTVFGTALATQTVSATLPLGTALGGVSVTVQDSAGATRPATMFAVSPSQVSFLIPVGTANGTATVTVTTANGSSTETINVTGSSPGLFAANDNGAGPLSAQVEIVTPSGTETFTNTAVVNGETYINAPIVLTPAASSFYLILYGTGFDSGTVSSVVVTINGKAYMPAFVGPQGGFAGLDQINVLLPASLAGSGTVNVSIGVNGTVSNTGTISFQ